MAAKKLKITDSFAADNDVDEAPAAAPVHSQIATEYRDLRGDLIAQAVVPLDSREQYIEAISDLWGRAQNAFVDIGRHLNNAKVRIPHGEFMKMIDADLPFGDRVANKLMVVAQALDEKLYPTERLPNSYSTIYELVKLGPDERVLAIREEVVRPDVTREEVLAFKRRLRTRRAPEQEMLRRRLDKLLADRRRIDEEIMELRRQLGEEGD